MAKDYYLVYSEHGREKTTYLLGRPGIDAVRRKAVKLAYESRSVVHIMNYSEDEPVEGSIRIDPNGPHYYTKNSIRAVNPTTGKLGAYVDHYTRSGKHVVAKKKARKSAWDPPYF